MGRNGVRLSNTYQIVSGGNMDFLNLQDPDRIVSKKVSKVQGFGGAAFLPESVHFGAEFVPFLRDRKVAYIRLEGDAFGGTPLELEVRMAVEDSPSAAGNVLDAVRYAKGTMDRYDLGQVDAISALLMKAPCRPMVESEALAVLRHG
jgi:myo-inositol-1-phosphate synthase